MHKFTNLSHVHGLFILLLHRVYVELCDIINYLITNFQGSTLYYSGGLIRLVI